MATSRLCSIPGCDNHVLARGWCVKHYNRWERNGDPLGVMHIKALQRSFRRCLIDGCQNSAHRKDAGKKGWCSVHYQRWKAHGNPTDGRAYTGEPRQYLHDKVFSYDGDDCLVWPFARNAKGYGIIHGGIVSRLVCEHVNGPPPTPEHQAAHSCGNGHEACCTKRHLSWKTAKENSDDRPIHGLSRSANFVII
jgi:hypothetical protein